MNTSEAFLNALKIRYGIKFSIQYAVTVLWLNLSTYTNSYKQKKKLIEESVNSHKLILRIKITFLNFPYFEALITLIRVYLPLDCAVPKCN